MSVNHNGHSAMLMLMNKIMKSKKKISTKYKGDFGFTIVEILIVLTVSTLLLSPVMIGLGSFYEDSLTSLKLSQQNTDVKMALATISNDLKQQATGFRALLTIPAASPQPPLGSNGNATAGGDWSYCGTTTTSATCDGVTTNDNYSSKRVLIAYVDATSAPTTGTSFNPVFLNSGAFDISTAARATNAYIYFVAPDRTNPSVNNLYRRTVVNVDAAGDKDWNNALYDCTFTSSANNCTTPSPSLDTKNSCASTVLSSNTAFCVSSDAVILNDVESFWVDYYDSSNQKIANTYTNVTETAKSVVSRIKSTAKSVQVTITKKLNSSSTKRSIASTRITNKSTLTAPIAAIQASDLPSYGTSFAMSPDGTKAYVVTQSTDTVTVINTSTNTKIATISVDANSGSYAAPDPIVITPDGSKVYVGNVNAGTVSVINTNTNTLTAIIQVGSQPYNIAMKPGGARVYVANSALTSGTSSVSVIDTSTDTVAATINAGIYPYQLAVTPDGTKVYVGHGLSNNTVTVIDTNTNTLANTIAASGARLVITPDGSKVIVGSDKAIVIDTRTNTVLASLTLPSGVGALAVTPDGKSVYMAHYYSNSVSVLNTSSYALAAVAVGTGPTAIEITPDGGKAYVGNDTSSNVSIIDIATNTNTGTVAVGAYPRALASTKDSSKIYVGSMPMYIIPNT